MARLSGTGTPCVGIENATGTVLLTRFCTNILTMPGDRNSLQIQTAGTYYLVLSEGGGSVQAYGYSLIFERVAPPTERAALIAPTQSVQGAISPVADRDLFRFRVAVGDRFTFRLSRLAGAGEPLMRMIDSSGALRTVSSGSTVSATESGTFGLWVYDSGDNEIFDYELQFACQGVCPQPVPE